MTDRSTRFWDKIAERYSKQPIADEAAYQKKLKVTRDYLRPDMEVLEFGCGTGSTAIAHAPYAKHIQAIDISSKMIEIARGKAKSLHIENVSFECSSISEFDAPDHSFDAVLGLNILHLLDNKEEAIAKVHRLLKRNGVFVTSTVCIGDTALRFLKGIVPIARLLGLMPMIKVLTGKELETSLVNAGFEIDYQWRPGKGIALFMVAKRVRRSAGRPVLQRD